jgi:glycosyltransferase involved in cell wall biosynthesis
MSYAPDCTVAICTRDSGALLERAVKSAVAQARVLIVDDYSSDGSVEQVRSAYPQVQVIRPCEKKGLGNARHTAVSAVETEWLIWLDADDEFLPGRVETLLESARANAADIVFDAAELWDGKTGRGQALTSSLASVSYCGFDSRLIASLAQRGSQALHIGPK